MDKQDLYQKIYRSPEELSAGEKSAIEKDPALKNEKKLASTMAKAIAARPLWTAPATLRQRLFEKLVRPTYKAWQIVLALLLVAVCPLFVPSLTGNLEPSVQAFYSTALFILYGLIVAFISFPLTFLLRQMLMTHFERLVDRMDGKNESEQAA